MKLAKFPTPVVAIGVALCAALSSRAEWKFLDTHDKTVADAVCRGGKGPCVKFGKNDNWGYVKGWKNGNIRFENALFEDVQGNAVDILGIDGDIVFADCTFRRSSAATVAMHPDYRNAVKNGAKPKGRIVFERCRFEGWEDVPLFSAEPYPMFDVTLKDCSFVRAGKRPGSTTTCAVPAIELGSWYDFGTSDLPDALKGVFEIEGLKTEGVDRGALVGVRDELGYTDFKGLFKGVDFSYSAPDRDLPRLVRISTANLGGTGGGPAFSESPFKLTWNGSYAVKPPQYTYYFRAKKGDRVSFALAYPDGGGSKERYAGLSLKLTVPSGKERDLGPIGPGRNEFVVTAEADGWYRFSNPKQAIVPIEARLVEFKGASLAYQADTENYSLAKFLLADKARPATGYFEVPAGTGSFRLAVLWGDLEIRNPKGEIVAAVGADDYRGRHVFDLKATSSGSEVWSFTAKGPGTHVIRFHAPLTGIWADSPEALPRLAKESIVFVGGHPDDTEGFAATAFLLREKYDLHVVDLTRGDAGLGPKGLADGSTARLRSAEEAEACKFLGATPHFLYEVDGDAYASKRSTDELTALLKDIRPKAVFTHWPVDAHPDHVQAAATTLHAVKRLGFPVQVYFYEVCLSQTRNWDPLISVDVTKTMDLKAQMLRKYVIGNGKDDWLVKTKTAQAKMRGGEREPACAYAETFTTMGGQPFADGVLENLDETSVPYGSWELKLPDGSRGWLRITGRAKAGTLDAWLLWNTKKPFRITAPERKGTFSLADGKVEFSFQAEPGNEATRCRVRGTVRGGRMDLRANDAVVVGSRIKGEYPSWLSKGQDR